MEVSVPKTEYADFKARNPDSLTLYLNGVKLSVKGRYFYLLRPKMVDGQT